MSSRQTPTRTLTHTLSLSSPSHPLTHSLSHPTVTFSHTLTHPSTTPPSQPSSNKKKTPTSMVMAVSVCRHLFTLSLACKYHVPIDSMARDELKPPLRSLAALDRVSLAFRSPSTLTFASTEKRSASRLRPKSTRTDAKNSLSTLMARQLPERYNIVAFVANGHACRDSEEQRGRM